ncbi:MAG: hypothetical protein ACPLW8_04925 [Candidatus Bathyarchaeales archaeon]
MRIRCMCVSILNIVLLAILSVSVYSSVYNTYYGQASPIMAETPKVILQQGTAGTSTIYTNNTSAKASVSAPVGVTYGQAFKSSNVRVSTTSGSPVDDSEAVLSVTLAMDSSIFIIYNAGNRRGSTEDYRGKGCAINVDGVDVAFSWQSPYSSNYANSVTVVYATTLTAGSHVIKGRFFANSAGATVGVDTRQIAAFWFPNVAAYYVRSTTASTTTSGTPVDDPQAVLTFSLSSDSVAFIIYNAGNRHGSTEPARGKGVTINVDGADIATRQWQSPYSSNYANSATIVYVCSLGAGFHTVKGRFFSNVAGSTTTINERQLIVFCFPANLITYGFVQSTTSVSTTSGTPVDDAQAVLSATLAGDSDVLMMYVGGNPHGASEDYDGKGVQLQIDGADKSNSASWQSPYGSNYANSATSLWCEQLTAGSHTIKGRFFANYAGYTVTISHRQLVALVFSKPVNYNYVLKTVNQVADAWKIRLRAYDQSNIGRLSNCTIYFYNGGGVSRQIYILNGAYNQQFGEWYDLNGLSCVYIAMIVSATSTGTSYIYVYLEVLVPNMSTYNLMIITFHIA